MFSSYIKTWEHHPNGFNSENISLFTLTEDNLDGINLLINNCFQSGQNANENVRTAIVHPNLWLSEFLEKNYDKISYVVKTPSFKILRIEEGEIVYKNFFCKTVNLTESEVDSFFLENKFKKLVIHSITKKIDLESLKKTYSIRYVDISQKGDERDNKLKEVLK